NHAKANTESASPPPDIPTRRLHPKYGNGRLITDPNPARHLWAKPKSDERNSYSSPLFHANLQQTAKQPSASSWPYRPFLPVPILSFSPSLCNFSDIFMKIFSKKMANKWAKLFCNVVHTSLFLSFFLLFCRFPPHSVHFDILCSNITL